MILISSLALVRTKSSYEYIYHSAILTPNSRLHSLAMTHQLELLAYDITDYWTQAS